MIYHFLLYVQVERDLTLAYIAWNTTDRATYIYAVGARQQLDIAMRKVDPWPRTDKSPSHMRTKANLQLFLENHRAEVHHENCPIFFSKFEA